MHLNNHNSSSNKNKNLIWICQVSKPNFELFSQTILPNITD